MTPPKVSVIMPTYNCARFLKVAVQSVLSQSYADLEIIVVNDGSSDNTDEVLGMFEDARLKRVTLEVHSGIPQARNVGIRCARGEYLTFFDSDDIMLPDAIAKRICFLERHSEVDAAFGWIDKVIGEDGAPMPSNELTEYIRQTNESYRARQVVAYNMVVKDTSFFGHTTLLYRQSFIQMVGFFDELLPPADDVDFTLRAVAISPFYFVDVPVMHYRIHSSNSSIFLKNNRIEHPPEAKTATKAFFDKHGLIDPSENKIERDGHNTT